MTLIESANRWLFEETSDNPDEDNKIKQPEIKPIEYKVGDDILYHLSDEDKEWKIGKVVTIMKNDVTISAANNTEYILDKEFVMPKAQKK